MVQAIGNATPDEMRQLIDVLRRKRETRLAVLLASSADGKVQLVAGLSRDLVEAALTLIAEKGPAGFTIAEAARLADVSPGAPYRHFRDADALLAEVALRGFERFATVLAAV